MTNNVQVDELAEVFRSGLFWDSAGVLPAEDAAEVLLGAGYRKLRTITKNEQIESLPAGTVVKERATASQFILLKEEDGTWSVPGDEEQYLNSHISFPVTVLWEPLP